MNFPVVIITICKVFSPDEMGRASFWAALGFPSYIVKVKKNHKYILYLGRSNSFTIFFFFNPTPLNLITIFNSQNMLNRIK